MIPFIVRASQFGNAAGFEWDGIVYTIVENLTLLLFLMQNYFFIYIGFIDFHRRFHMIQTVGAMILPMKEGYSIKYRIFPTINLACRTSIHSWFLLRQATLDFGKKYMNRIFIYASTFLGGYTFYLVIILLSFFKILNYEFTLIFNSLAIFDIFLVLASVLSILHYGAAINEQYIYDMGHLLKIKQSLMFVQAHLGKILSGDSFSGAYVKIF